MIWNLLLTSVCVHVCEHVRVCVRAHGQWLFISGLKVLHAHQQRQEENKSSVGASSDALACSSHAKKTQQTLRTNTTQCLEILFIYIFMYILNLNIWIYEYLSLFIGKIISNCCFLSQIRWKICTSESTFCTSGRECVYSRSHDFFFFWIFFLMYLISCMEVTNDCSSPGWPRWMRLMHATAGHTASPSFIQLHYWYCGHYNTSLAEGAVGRARAQLICVVNSWWIITLISRRARMMNQLWRFLNLKLSCGARKAP